VAFAAGAVAVAGSAAWVTASAAGYNVSLGSPSAQPAHATAALAPEKSTNSSALCTDFIGHLTSDLGSNKTKFDAALQKAIGETLADQVKSKALTQAQADAIKKKLAGKAACDLISAPGLRAPSAGAAKESKYREELLAAAASALGITDAQLKTDLGQGMTLKQIAGQHKPPISETEFRASLIKNLTPLLDKAVAAKDLTSDQEKAILQKLQTGPIPYWDKPLKKKPAPTTAAPVTAT
jgi:hypothetical protein